MMVEGYNTAITTDTTSESTAGSFYTLSAGPEDVELYMSVYDHVICQAFCRHVPCSLARIQLAQSTILQNHPFRTDRGSNPT